MEIRATETTRLREGTERDLETLNLALTTAEERLRASEAQHTFDLETALVKLEDEQSRSVLRQSRGRVREGLKVAQQQGYCWNRGKRCCTWWDTCLVWQNVLPSVGTVRMVSFVELTSLNLFIVCSYLVTETLF